MRSEKVLSQSLDMAGRFRLSHRGGRAGSVSVIRVVSKFCISHQSGQQVLYQSLEWAGRFCLSHQSGQAGSVSVIRVCVVAVIEWEGWGGTCTCR